MGEPLESNYFSSGSTVTRDGLQKMCQTYAMSKMSPNLVKRHV